MQPVTVLLDSTGSLMGGAGLRSDHDQMRMANLGCSKDGHRAMQGPEDSECKIWRYSGFKKRREDGGMSGEPPRVTWWGPPPPDRLQAPWLRLLGVVAPGWQRQTEGTAEQKPLPQDAPSAQCNYSTFLSF